MNRNILEIRDLKKWFPVTSGLLGRVKGNVKAVDAVELEIEEGEPSVSSANLAPARQLSDAASYA